MYRVIESFTDIQDNGYTYNVGDQFPRKGVAVTPDRIRALASTQNKRGIALILEVGEAEVKPRKRAKRKSEE